MTQMLISTPIKTKGQKEHYVDYGICHMHNIATYPFLRHMLGYTSDQQLHH